MNKLIDDLISSDQYRINQKHKINFLLPLLKEQMQNSYNNNLYYKSMIDKMGLDIQNVSSLESIPPLPVNSFKNFDLSTSDDIFIVLESSGTTNSNKSKIPLNKTSSVRQRKALISTFSSKLGKKRRPLLVFDSSQVANERHSLSARGAAIRGLSIFSKETSFAFKDPECKIVDEDSLALFVDKNKGKQVIIFGFTYILWRKLIEQNMFNLFELFDSPLVVHGGGWKKLQNISVSKEIFDDRISRILGTLKSHIIDYYGMVEQIGVIFLDCEKGNKMVPDFAEVIVRDFYTMKPCEAGVNGYINILSVLPDSYPGMSIVTEDIGHIVDNCECGSVGKCFRFVSRVEKSEARGCGDTFVE